MRKPSDAGPDRVDPADDFVAGDDRNLRVGQLAVDDMQVGAANAASGHFDPNFVRPRLSVGEICPFERSPELLKHHSLHDGLR